MLFSRRKCFCLTLLQRPPCVFLEQLDVFVRFIDDVMKILFPHSLASLNNTRQLIRRVSVFYPECSWQLLWIFIKVRSVKGVQLLVEMADFLCKPAIPILLHVLLGWRHYKLDYSSFMSRLSCFRSWFFLSSFICNLIIRLKIIIILANLIWLLFLFIKSCTWSWRFLNQVFFVT